MDDCSLEEVILKLSKKSLIAKRQEYITKVSDQLTEGEFSILTYHNQARANNFLMFYGRIIRELAPTDSYFDFVEKIPAFGTEAKSLPDVILYNTKSSISEKMILPARFHPFWNS